MIQWAETNRGRIEGDVFVLCAGPWAGALARPLGIKLPIYPVKGYSVTLAPGENAPAISITDTAHRFVCCRLGEKLRIAGFAEFAGLDSQLDERQTDALLAVAQRLFPGAADYKSPVQAWTGLRPMTPNGLPLIGRTRIRNLLLNVGHGAFGWTWALGSAERVLTALQQPAAH